MQKHAKLRPRNPQKLTPLTLELAILASDSKWHDSQEEFVSDYPDVSWDDSGTKNAIIGCENEDV